MIWNPVQRSFLVLISVFFGVATVNCGDDDGPSESDSGVDVTDTSDVSDSSDTTDTTETEDPLDEEDIGPELPFFLFGLAPDQPISSAPFPNDLYIGADGFLALARLDEDPRIGELARPELLELYTEYTAELTGFGSISAIWFFTNSTPDLASLEERVRLITLVGPEAGREIEVQAFWSGVAGAIGVFPAWGDYLVPGSTYGAIITNGLTDELGDTVEASDGVAEMLSDTAPDPALETLHTAWGPLRDWLGEETIEVDDVLIATVFTTEEVLPRAQSLFDAVDEYVLTPPSNRIRWDVDDEDFEEASPIEGEGLDGYFGVPTAPFEYNPGVWGASNRENAAALTDDEQEYEGGTGHFGIGRVLNGSILVPSFNYGPDGDGIVNGRLQFEDGAPLAPFEAMVPFSLFLCDEHLDDPSDLPVAIFSHGGGAIRGDAIAWANANCRVGVATIAIDMIYHGGRRLTVFLPDQGSIIAPTVADDQNFYSGLSQGDEGFVPDSIGDKASAVDSVAPLYSVGNNADPLIIEANLLTIATDTATLVRYLQEGDWSAIQEGLSFESTEIFHESLSFGTSFHTPLMALSDDFAGVIGSVGSGIILSVNMPMAPVNAVQASFLVQGTLGLPTIPTDLIDNSLVSPVLGIHQWLHERGDPMVYAPFVLRHQNSDRLTPMLHSGDSWDETLHSPAQMTYAQALGAPVYTHGEEWTIDATVPGSERLNAEAAPGDELQNNATFGDNTTTAAHFFLADSCHSQVVTSLCANDFVHPYPPVLPLDSPAVAPSPVCALHAQTGAFLRSILDGGPAVIDVPEGTCAELYGP